MKNHTEAEQPNGLPVERVTELLAGHTSGVRYPRDGSVRAWCSCDWVSGPIDLPNVAANHAAHLAGVLADAGMIPTQREWGVEDEYSVIGFGGNEHAARTWAEGGTRPVVSRWTGATAWEASDE